MTEFRFQVSDQLAAELQKRAESQGVTVSRLVSNLLEREVRVREGWPEGFFEQVVGAWEGPLERPAQIPFEKRDEL